MSRDPVALRTYRSLVKLYPRRFRDEYGADMVAMFREQCRDESAWRVTTRAALDLVLTVPTQRLEATMHRSSRTLVPLIYLAIAVAGFAGALLGGTNPVPILAGLAIMVGAGAFSVVAWRRSGSVRATTLSSSWWRFLVSGPCLVAAVIVAAGLGVEAWYLGMLTLLVALVLTTVGLGLGVAHLLNRRNPQDPPVSFSSGTS